jgi:hypothetical protein
VDGPLLSCWKSFAAIFHMPPLEWEGPGEAQAQKIWKKIWKFTFSEVDLSRKRLAMVLPEGIPGELQKGVEELNRAMGDNPRFVKWKIQLELEAEAEVRKTADHPEDDDRFRALRSVILARASQAGWSEPVLVFSKAAFQWRRMLSLGKLFIDTEFSSRRHTAGAHLLQLLYASECLNAIPELRDSPTYKNGGVMPTLMRFMGDAYQVNGEPFKTKTRLKWRFFDRQRSLWSALFDREGLFGQRGINSPSTIGNMFHAFRNVSQIERWAGEANANYP